MVMLFFTRIFVFSQLFVFPEALDVSGKLDFGESRESALLRKTDQRMFSPIRYKKISKSDSADKTDDFKIGGIVCTSDGCNSTSNQNSDTKQTDVVVNVQTQVILNANTKIEEDDLDVPVVVGHSGSTLDLTIDDEVTRSFLPKTIDTSEPIPINLATSRNQFKSSTNSFIDRSLDFNQDFQPAVYVENEPHINNIHTKDLPSRTVLEDASKLAENGIQLQIPYYEPSHSNHYFGEQPPPQFIWYPNTHTMKSQVYNPVEFKNIYKTNWRPSHFISRSFSTHRHGSNSACQCSDRRIGSVTSLQWDEPRGSGMNMNIDDKLAPPFHKHKM